MRNKKFGILVLVALLSLSNPVMADDNTTLNFNQNTTVEKIKANKDTLLKAQEAMDAKDYQTAINLLTSYINEKPKKYEVYKLRGDAYYALRRYIMAQRDYQTAIDIKSSEDKLMTNTKYVSAIVLGADKNEQLQNAELGDLYGALMYAQKATNDPAYTTSYNNAVKYNSHIYLPQPNKNEINKINCPQKYGKVLNPQGIDIKIYGAIDDIAKGNFNESLYKLQDVTRQYPNYYFGHYLTGVALSELEKEDDAIKSFQTAISLNPYDFESRASLGRIYYSKAETTFSEASARKSIEYFNQAIKQNKNCPTYYFYIGMNELQIGNTNVAISNFDKALQINPSDYNSMYYKLIAQYINGNYQDVVDGTSKLLIKHVSNYNSVLYLRALAYAKLNDNDRALQDLNTIDNNIEDIYNSDIRTTSAREKSLESYVHYLKGEIQHSKGAGSAEDNTIAYSNPIIDRLANAQKAMEPYEKSMRGDSISLSDYNKFESFYSTSLPKLLESGAVITYDDIDNQYDYIRTTFADLGISFLYLNPDYKITTIKDYPYKKYSSKLNKDELNSLSARPASDMENVELAKTQETTLRKTTPPSELIAKSGQQSLAQMLASDALSAKQKPVEIKNPIVIRDSAVQASAPKFNPETPDAEKIDTSKNIASGETYVSKNPSINTDNTKQVNKILSEEKKIQSITPVVDDNGVKKNIETAQNGSVKISVQNPVQTGDVVIRNKTAEIPAVSSAVKTTSDVVENITDNTVKTVENAEQSAKEAKRLAKEQAKAEKEAAKLAQKEAKQKLAEEKEALKLVQKEEQERLKQEKESLKLAQKQAENELQKEVHVANEQIAQVSDSMRDTQKAVNTNSENLIAQTQNSVGKIVEKHANIEPDVNVQKQSDSLTINEISDIVELDTTNLSKKLNNESDLFNSNTVFTNPQAQIRNLTPPVTLPEEPIKTETVQKAQEISVQAQSLNNNAQIQEQETKASVSVVNVPEMNTPELRILNEQVNQQQIEPKTEGQVAQSQAESQTQQVQAVAEKIVEPEPEIQLLTNTLDEEFVTEKLSKVINQISPKQNADNYPYSATAQYSDVEMTLYETNTIKEKRQKLKEEARYEKERKKALARKEKEQRKLEQEQEHIALMAQKDAIKAKEKAEKQKEQEKLDKIKQDLKQQKAFEKEQLKLEQQQAKLAQTETQITEQKTESAVKSWLNSIFDKSDNQEQKVEKSAQQVRAEQSRQVKKLEKEMAKQQKALVHEQEKIIEQNDETKIQRLKAKLTAMRGSITDEEKKAQKAQLKAERAKAKEEYKAKQLARKSVEDTLSEAEKLVIEQQKAEQKAIEQAKKLELKEQRAYQKAKKDQIKQEQKIINNAKKLSQKNEKAHEKAINSYSESKEKFSFKNMFSKMKFWKKQ